MSFTWLKNHHLPWYLSVCSKSIIKISERSQLTSLWIFIVTFEKISRFFLKETRNSFKNWTLNLWWTSNKSIMEMGNVTKATTFKSFLHQSYKKTYTYFLVWQCFLIIFMRKALTDDFWGLYKNKNCAFPLKFISFWNAVWLRKKFLFELNEIYMVSYLF